MKSSRALKKADYAEEVDEGTWALSYGDMITLLLSFFVIFFTTDQKEEKVEKLNRHMSFVLEGPLTSKTQGAGTGHLGKNTISEGVPEIKIAEVKVNKIGDQLIVTFENVSFFDTASTQVHQDGERVLKAFAEKFKPYIGNYRVSVKGFTDKRKVKKRRFYRKFDDNLELSALRSISAMRVLQSAGIPLNRMEIAGIGEMNAISSIYSNAQDLNEDEVNSLSRTIVLVIKNEQESWL